ncbi:MAG TPA: S4 domain-containing protein YaaA [Firmicutes bacterium]|jgi:ribosome-associated protein|nr:S4 domain-containing protein YaaA [Bacillota bacterium]
MGEKVVHIKGEYITLAQLLKKLDYISSGGESRFFLQENLVTVNGQREDRRGRKLYVGDRLTIAGQEIVLG